MDIGKMINQRRTELGLTLEEVGKVVGVSKSTVKKWEDGFISNMKRDKIALLAKVLQLNPVAFITGDVSAEVKIFNLSSHEKDVVTAYRNKPEMQPAVDKLLGVADDEMVALPMAARSVDNRPVAIEYISKEKLERLRNAKSVEDEVDL